MHILYLSPHVPNPTKIRSHFHVRGLLEAGHDVTVATLERTPDDAKHLERLRQTGIKVISAPLTRFETVLNSLSVLPTRQPLQAAFMESTPLTDKIDAHLRSTSTDLIHVEHLRMARYGLRLVPEWPVVWDAVDYLSDLYKQAARESTNLPLRLISRLEAPRLRNYELELTGLFPTTLVISPNDLARFQQDNPYANRIQLALTGVPILSLPDEKQRAQNLLIITGTLNYHPNVASVLYFCRQIMPLIQKQAASVHLQLVGAHPVPAIQGLKNDHIEITGFVPSITDYLHRATIALAPMVYGSGMQIKVLEAFMTATPLVATSVALRGLDVRHNKEVLIADTPADFSAAVIRLLSDRDLQAHLGMAGRRYIEQHHDLNKTTQRLVEIYRQVMAAG